LHNQAMMEFGAILCKPKNPACAVCPVRMGCYAFLNNAVATLPVKLNNLKVRDRFFNYFLVTDGQTVLVNKRDETDIWANMYDLPLIETSSTLYPNELLALHSVRELFGPDIKILETFPVKKHLLTHQRLFVQLIKIQCQPVKLKAQWFFIPVENLKKLAIPKIIFIFIKNIFNL
jgi:A/G-specific adenine glycosylase